MKIRTQFMISAVILGLILLLVATSVIVTNQWVENTHRQEALALQIESEAYELGYLANDYLLYRESQQANRWESKFVSFSNDVSNLELNTPEQKVLLANIKTNQQRLKTIFEEVRAGIESAPQTQKAGLDAKFMQVSWSRLEVQNQGMIFDASRLERMLTEQEDQLRRLTSLLSFVLIGVLGLYLFGNYRLTFRRILQAIAGLQAGTRIIGSGDLDFAIAVKNEDEIGELSRAFNQMTANLKQVTASKTDLEKEITERKQVENALRESEQRYSTIFNESPIAMSLTKMPEGILMGANNTFLKLFEFKREEVIGKTSVDLGIADADSRAQVAAEMRAHGSVQNFEVTRITKTGVKRILSLNLNLVSIDRVEHILTTIRDITERRQAEEHLEQSNRKINEILESIQDDFYVLGRDWNFVYASRLFTSKVGKEPQDFVGNNIWEMFPKHVGTVLEENFRAAMEKRETRRFELGGRYTTAWYRMTVFPSADGITVIGTDVTERRRTEEALRRNEALLHETSKVAKIGGWELDLQTNHLVWTLQTYHIHEVDPSLQPELEGAINFYASEARPQITEAVRRATEEGQSYDLELPFITAKGRNIWIRTMGRPEFSDGRCVRLFGTFQDITERKQAEEGLRRFELLSAYSKDIILFMRRDDGRILEVNTAAIQAYGYSRDELLAITIRGLRAQDTQSLTADQMAQADTKGILFATVHRRKDGSTFPVEVSSQGATINGVRTLISIVRDITERRQAEEKLARQAEDLRRSNTELEQFAYVASHDLQEPLRALSGFSQLLERRYKGRLDQDADEFIGFIVDAAARMQKLIMDLLAYSRAGHGGTNMVEVDCNQLLRRLVESMAFTIEAADGQVTFDKLPTVTAHESSLIQLFQNLIGNALKFRGDQPPCVHISARRAEGEWFFSVADNGIGLEPQYYQRVFMIFQRLHNRNEYPGTGIGLSICKKIVENLGGRIWVESEPGQGTTFSFTIPVNANTKEYKWPTAK
jgi:PAS domain S-box-containing protein